VRAVVARVRRASVTVEAPDGTPLRVSGEIGPGLLVLLGVHADDVGTDPAATARKVDTMARKLHELRLLRDERSCADAGAPLLVVSQFTLYGETRKGRRPSWSAAARPQDAEPVVDAVVAALRGRGARVATGKFGADMSVESSNDGPFTVLVEI
jgi:D-aminoacyl-tRNA deacylase